MATDRGERGVPPGPPDRAAGTLLGLAAGDRKGGPVRMAIRLADSLRHRGAFDVEDIGHRYVQWWTEGAFDTGATTAKVLERVHSGMSFEDASKEVHEEAHGLTAGCAAAHRIGPLSMLHALPDGELPATAVLEAGLTHRHPLAGDAAAAVAVLCRALIRGLDWTEALAVARRGRMPDTCSALEVREARVLARGGFAPDTLAAAVHLVGTCSSFEEALGDALRFAGPANYCPVLVGSIGGARWGASEIPPAATDHVGDLLTTVLDLGHRLGAAW